MNGVFLNTFWQPRSGQCEMMCVIEKEVISHFLAD